MAEQLPKMMAHSKQTATKYYNHAQGNFALLKCREMKDMNDVKRLGMTCNDIE